MPDTTFNIAIASKTAAVNCVFDLESEELNSDVAKALSPECIFDAVQLSSSLTIVVDGVTYELTPYWTSLTEDDTLTLLEDMYTSHESALLQQKASHEGTL